MDKTCVLWYANKSFDVLCVRCYVLCLAKQSQKRFENNVIYMTSTLVKNSNIYRKNEVLMISSQALFSPSVSSHQKTKWTNGSDFVLKTAFDIVKDEFNNYLVISLQKCCYILGLWLATLAAAYLTPSCFVGLPLNSEFVQFFSHVRISLFFSSV